jgi:hypothetical protein
VSTRKAVADLDLAALEEITAAVESGAGLPTVVRSAAKALAASIVVLDRGGQALAVAARSPADERSLLASSDGVEALELRVADVPVGQMRLRARGVTSPGLVRLVTTLVASEVERVRAPERESEEESAAFLSEILAHEFTSREELLERARGVGLRDLERGTIVLVVHARAQAPAQEGWRSRLRLLSARGARGVAPSAVAVLSEREITGGAEVIVLLPGADEAAGRRAADNVLRDVQAGLGGFAFVVGRSRPADDPLAIARAADEALLAANVAEGDSDARVLGFEETGAYRLLLRRAVRDRSRGHGRRLSRCRRERGRYRAAPLYPSAHDPLPTGACARTVRSRRRLERRTREAEPRPESDAGSRDRRRQRAGKRAWRDRRPRARSLEHVHD